MRIRTIKPEFFLHEGLFDLEREMQLPIRLSFAGLWCAADREGRFKWEPRKLKAQILPYDEVDFSRVLDALTTRGFVVRYASNGADLGCIPSFSRHQVINNRERESELPPPPEQPNLQPVDACPTRAPRVEDACPTVLSPAQAEGKGREGNKEVPPNPLSGGVLELLPPEDPHQNNGSNSHALKWSSVQLRLNALFRRRPTTAWSGKELRAFKKLGEVNNEDLSLVEAYYTAKIPPDKDIRRKDLCTLLNNFPGEIDRARNFKQPTQRCF